MVLDRMLIFFLIGPSPKSHSGSVLNFTKKKFEVVFMEVGGVSSRISTKRRHFGLQM